MPARSLNGSNLMDRLMEDLDLVGDSLLHSSIASPVLKAQKTQRLPHTFGALHPGATFAGFQSCQRQSYKVTVDIKHVDLRESFLCGYLTIDDLTPTEKYLTTFFEAEVIGTKYQFRTRKWGAMPETDQRHWGRFDHFAANYADRLDDDSFRIDNVIDEPFIYMRWKEHFLVPDHRVVDVVGASYAGFYYMCFDVDATSFRGYYFHSDSEEFQNLNLSYEKQNTSASFKFR